MKEEVWLTSADWLLLWHYAIEKEYLTDRKRRLMAVAGCRGIIGLVSDPRLTRMLELAEEWADATGEDFAEKWWGRREDWCDEADAAASVPEVPGGGTHRAAAWAFAMLGNDDYKVGRSIESVAAVYGCPAATAGGREGHSVAVSCLVREVVGNPFRPVAFDPAWRTGTAVSLARGMYEARDFAAVPILADALQDAGCDDEQVLGHCRDPQGTHVRGCWVVDLVLGKA